MSRLTELLRQARKADKQLGDDLEKDLTKHHVRQAIRDAKTAKGLYESGVASDY